MDESASLLAPTANLLPNSAIQDPVEDHNGEDEDASSVSTADLCNMIEFELERSEYQTLNVENLLNDPTSQCLELKVNPSEIYNSSQNLEFEDFLNHNIFQSLELEGPPILPNSQSLELEVHPSHPNSQSLESEFLPNNNATKTLNLEDFLNDPTSQCLELEVTPSEMHNSSHDLEFGNSLNHHIFRSSKLGGPLIIPNSQSLELEVHPSHPNFQSLDSDFLPNNNTSQSLELQVVQNVSSSQPFPNVSNQQQLHAQQDQIAPTSPHYNQHFQLLPPSNKRKKTSNKPSKMEYERIMMMEKRNNVISHNPSAFEKIINQGKPRISCYCIKTECSKRYCSCYKEHHQFFLQESVSPLQATIFL